jgi:uncharacterized protein (DUF433 family)
MEKKERYIFTLSTIKSSCVLTCDTGTGTLKSNYRILLDGALLSYEVGEVAMRVETRYKHIVLDQDQVPRIADTTMKVIELVLAHLAYGWSPDELHFQFPHLSLGQIHSALAYYWDHRPELDADIERRLESVDALRSSLGESSLIIRLKAKGLI